MMILTAYLLNKYTKGYDKMDKEECILAGTFWPFVLCFFLVALPISGIMWMISAIAEKWDIWEKKSKK
jgi:hypothetical protein